MPPNGTNLAITNPLVLYRSLIATNRLAPDPAQHRLALNLQKLYERLIDYEPNIEYSQRLQQLSRAVGAAQDVQPQEKPSIGTRGIWTSLLKQKEKRDSLALTRVLTSPEAAMALESPKGLMLHGEVGTGKSMLIDLFADCLPNKKKRRWHFNTFMLDTFSRLEALRKNRLALTGELQDEYSLLWLARDLIQTSPILFLDEFQFPDRAASKILSNLMTSFFQLGGVLIATSNRMPDELAKAAGIEFARPVSRFSRLGWSLGLPGIVGRDDGPGQKGEFAVFLEVLKSRCEVWEMEGKRDYRRIGAEKREVATSSDSTTGVSISTKGLPSSATTIDGSNDAASEPTSTTETLLPKYFLIDPSPEELAALITTTLSLATTDPWTPHTLTVYGRPFPIPRQHASIAHFTFAELCTASLGPADYITLASTYHTLILTDVPVLTFLQKNEARRFITFLDALYEARCRLLLTAATTPDSLFFPTSPSSDSTNPTKDGEVLDTDATHPETYSEIHQDLTSPFRPNVSSYGGPSLAADALEDDPPNRVRRPGSSYTDERARRPGPDFANIGGLTGEDERFAVKRAESRIWELCAERWWWGRGGKVEEWWRPLPGKARHWERGAGAERAVGEGTGKVEAGAGDDVASPFRTTSDSPPKIQWTHVWGTIKWGKKAGAWGKGVEGLEERKREKDRDGDGQDGTKSG
ncbi:hypothetical protein BS50DRAFT_90170 [Corynespora cassiicola Philippines]|uniref:AAA+ ATPase domain-containing protein n=1 Tax=Corynespora cassiicola Philippines TaxID=1448308 RepID=A0A2T2NEN5_CORCC|nr:hypothetical protein BS50DRAFT_90170 [Corynespora cassiicola Philippines]